jgi:hypothetical protein
VDVEQGGAENCISERERAVGNMSVSVACFSFCFRGIEFFQNIIENQEILVGNPRILGF